MPIYRSSEWKYKSIRIMFTKTFLWLSCRNKLLKIELSTTYSCNTIFQFLLHDKNKTNSVTIFFSKREIMTRNIFQSSIVHELKSQNELADVINIYFLLSWKVNHTWYKNWRQIRIWRTFRLKKKYNFTSFSSKYIST